MVNMKLKFVNTGDTMAGTLTGKPGKAAKKLGTAFGRSAETGIAVLMIQKGGMMGIAIVGCLILIKTLIEADL